MLSCYRVYVYVLVTVLTWSHAFVAIKYCLRYVTPWELLLLRHVPAALVFCAYLGARRSSHELRQILRDDGVRFLLLGAAAVTGYHLALNMGSQVIPSGTVSLVIGSSPVFTLVMAALLIRERPALWQISGVIIAFAGLYVCIRFGGGKDVDLRYVSGALVLLLSPFFASIHTTLSRPLSRKYGALNTTAFTIVLGTVPLLAGADADLIRKAAALPAGFWAADLFLGLGCTAFAYLLWTKALQVMEATKVAVFLYLIPVLGIAWGWLYLDEPVSWWLVAGAALVIFGVVLANRKAAAPAAVS